MALIYATGVNEIDNPTYADFATAWESLANVEATQLAFADRLAERARLLRKAILNRVVVNDAESAYEDASESGTIYGAASGTALVAPWNTQIVTVAAVDCFKAANNDI